MISAFSMLPMDIRSQGPQVPDRVLIAPLDMVDIADAGFPLRHEARYQQRRPAPQAAATYLSAVAAAGGEVELRRVDYRHLSTVTAGCPHTGEAEGDLPPEQPPGLTAQTSAGFPDSGSQAAQSAQMQVNGPGAQLTAAIGCQVKGAGSSTVCVLGRPKTHDAAFAVMPDRIAAATYPSPAGPG